MEKYLGIDVGGNHVKTGFVDTSGEVRDFQTFSTAEMKAGGNFVKNLISTISYRLINHKDVKRVGLALPGTLTKDRTSCIEVTSIPTINGLNIKDELQKAFPDMHFFLENDANAAALGEFYYSSSDKMPDTYGFITLGTGVGSAAVIERQIFKGGDGNGLELGHILSRNNKSLEQNIGKQGILNLIEKRLSEYTGETLISRDEPVSATKTVVAAKMGDELAQQIFFEVGEILGEGLVAFIRIMDIKTIVVGGGLSAAFQFIKPGVEKVINEKLTPYYTKDFKLVLASLGNDAGLLGAAALCH